MNENQTLANSSSCICSLKAKRGKLEDLFFLHCSNPHMSDLTIYSTWPEHVNQTSALEATKECVCVCDAGLWRWKCSIEQRSTLLCQKSSDTRPVHETSWVEDYLQDKQWPLKFTWTHKQVWNKVTFFVEFWSFTMYCKQIESEIFCSTADKNFFFLSLHVCKRNFNVCQNTLLTFPSFFRKDAHIWRFCSGAEAQMLIFGFLFSRLVAEDHTRRLGQNKFSPKRNILN